MHIEVEGIRGLPMIRKGDDLPALISRKAIFSDGDILCIASSVYSKAKRSYPLAPGHHSLGEG